MTRTELAALLGVSPSMVSRLAKRGMPTDDVERARRWRRRHLEPARVKGVRADTREDTAASAGGATADHLAVQLVRRLADLAERDPAQWSEDFRVALAAVPLHRRPDLMLPLELLQGLVQPDLDALGWEAEPEAAAAQGEADAELVGATLLGLVARDLQVLADRGLAARTPAGGAILAALARACAD